MIWPYNSFRGIFIILGKVEIWTGCSTCW